MKKYFLFVFAIILVLNACSPTATQAIPPSSSPTDTPTATPTITATATQTPAIATITPLPTIPTFTPTFDVRTIVTATSAPKAECPRENPELIADFPIPDLNKCIAGSSEFCFTTGTGEKIQNFLNSGGSIIAVEKRLEQAHEKNNESYFYKDITNDTVPEFMFQDFGVFTGFNIFTCKDGRYELFRPLIDPPSHLYSIEDMNKNGMPEIVLVGGMCSGSGCVGIGIFEWDGNTYKELSENIGIMGPTKIEFKDINQDKIKEIVLVGDRPGTCCEAEMIPWRFMTIVYSWNGTSYVESYRYFDPPQYRFQAVQDGDRETYYGNYDKALSFYQDAIFSAKLGWWSKDRKSYKINEFLKNFYNGAVPTPTLIPTPALDATEYPKLAAYAYYRIMLLHIVQNHPSDAETVYKTLQQKFGNDPYGRQYVEMATAFWNAYQSTNKMYDGCASTIEYAAEHPEILVPLGSDYHGWQSKIYKPEDVCPFR